MEHHATHIAGRAVALCAAVILVWCVRGVVLSGAPLYPSTIGYIPVEWAVPEEDIADVANWIYSWARQPDTHWSSVLGNWEWFKPWLLGVSKQTTQVVFPLTISALFGTITLVLCLSKKGTRSRSMEWAVLLPSIIGLTYWFFTAPIQRFAHALFFITSICSSILFLSSIQSISSRRTFFAMIWVVLLVANLHFVRFFVVYAETIKNISVSGWHPVIEVPLDKKTTLSGLSVYTPKEGEQCFDSLLPSTPYFNTHLRLRNPESMSSGFTVTRKEK